MAKHDDNRVPSAKTSNWVEVSRTATCTPDERLAAAQAVADDCLRRRHSGEEISDADILEAHADLMPELGQALAAIALINNLDLSPTGGQSSIHSADTVATDALEAEIFGSPAQREVEGYDVLNEIHRGGQGVVYRAVQASTQRVVALKILLEGPGSSEQARARFQREVQLIARLQHPGIVVIHDSGITRGQYYYAMEFIDGQPLDRYLDAHDLPLRKRVDLFVQVCDAVAYAHQKGVIHRDLKPANILVTSEGKPVVVDFGLAKMEEDDSSSAHALTKSGHLLGTYKYMSPEQTKGDHNALDVRSDIYTLGVILYEVISGEFPYRFSGDIADLFSKVRTVDPPRPSLANSQSRIVGSELDAITLKAMEKEHARRYQSCAALSEDLRAWLGGEPVLARSQSTLYMARKLATRRPRETAVLALMLISIAAFGAISYSLYSWYVESDARYQRSEKLRLLENEGFNSAALMAKIQQPGGQAALGWFLDAWTTGRNNRAKDIYAATQQNNPAYARVMAYLLAAENDEETLQNEALNGIPGLRDFARGLRFESSGAIESAIQSFGASLAAEPSDWLKSEASARRQHLLDLREAQP